MPVACGSRRLCGRGDGRRLRRGPAAATAENVTMTGGANGRVGQLEVEDAQITFNPPVPGGQVYAPGEDAPLQVTIVNTGDEADRLTGVSSPAATSVGIVGETRLPGGQVLTAGYDDPIESITLPGATDIEITMIDLATPLRAGLTYPVTFTFEKAGELRLELPLENPDVLPPRAENPAPDGPEQPPDIGSDLPETPR